MNDYAVIRGDAEHIPLPDRSVDLVLGSPPYRKARLYLEAGRNLGIARDTEDWIDWMLRVTTEALRVSRGAVIWVAAGSTEARNSQPICEGLMYRWWQSGGHAYRPCYWHRVGIAGSGGDQWFRPDVEYAMCFKRPGELPWADNTVMGHPPKWAPGGAMSHRLSDGTRRDRWGANLTSGGARTADGTRRGAGWSFRRNGVAAIEEQSCAPPVLANPGNLIHTSYGGNQLGHRLAHENEAPFPVVIPEFFIRSLCPPGGMTLDPFSGSGTTIEAALKHGRFAIGLDLRLSQCRLARRRIDRPHAPVINGHKGDKEMPLFAASIPGPSSAPGRPEGANRP
jgi:hypothetical protein